MGARDGCVAYFVGDVCASALQGSAALIASGLMSLEPSGTL